MKKIKKYFLFALIIIGTLIISFQPVTDYAKDYLETLFSLSNPINDDPIFDDLKINHHYIDKIDSYYKDNYYFLDINFKNIFVNEINSIKINNNLYEDDDLLKDQTLNYIKIKLNESVEFDLNPFHIIYLDFFKIEKATYSLNYSTYIFKEISDETITETKKSVVSIKTTDLKGNSSWGSGVILFKDFNSFFNQYEYYVITNHHVVEDGRTFLLYYQGENQKPSFPVYAHLVAHSDDTTDLALLKFSSFKSISSIYEDSSFLNDEAKEFIAGQPIYIIGSPKGRNINFNKVSKGFILKTKIKVVLTDSNTICQNGCNAFKTSAIILEGSSGGGTFDADGNLIGIHFAGSENKTFSSSIPMKDVLKFIKPYLKNVSYKKEVQFNGLLFYTTL